MTPRHTQLCIASAMAVMGFVAGLLAGQWHAPANAAPGPAMISPGVLPHEVTSMQLAPTASSRAGAAVPHVVSTQERALDADAGQPAYDDGQPAREPAEVVVHKVRTMARIGMPGGMNEEFALQAAQGYISGVAAGIIAASPQLAEETLDAITHSVCEGTAARAELGVLVSLATALPRSARDARIFDCALERHTSEDAVLWHLLDLRQGLALEPTPAFQAWATRAADERTQRRLAAQTTRETPEP